MILLGGCRLNKFQFLLEFLVRKELVTPLGLRFLNLVAQALSEFHRFLPLTTN
uniref:Uncharacterized protein n=1 Tax=Lotus japonicus TaxID=34305 RepID=I3S127_LOTJA|nr:unknown [Lotus japonicus]